MLAGCAAQPLVCLPTTQLYSSTKKLPDVKYGKISNIFGRKPVLLTAYLIFGLGSIISYVKSASKLVPHTA